MLEKARAFIKQFGKEMKKPIEQRLKEIEEEIVSTGTYTHTEEELVYGAKVAWRNSNKCIGRLFWNSLHVFDHRRLEDEEEIFEALVEHIRYATNGGKIRPTISIFAPGRVRIWNDQLIRYAGYEKDEQVIGDTVSLDVTKKFHELGFPMGDQPYDILPLVIQVDDRPPKMFSIPKDAILEVPITHSQYPKVEQIGMRWYAVPIISNMGYEVGGITYEAAPFNGWYMGTEIGARNLADEDRYNFLPQVAEAIGIEAKRAHTLWKDRALVELNYAVLESYKQAGVSIVDHHTAAQQFQLFEQQEEKEGRDVTGNWTWLIPPLSPATTHIFHRPYNNTKKSPNYIYQQKPFHLEN